MRFGKTLSISTYLPWKDQYIDYNKLKQLLRESASGADNDDDDDDDDAWTERDETAFVEELVNTQLEKVATFQAKTLKRLQDETAECEKDLEPLGAKASESKDGESNKPSSEHEKILKSVLAKLDGITKETNELEKYSRVNYTGFLKAAKKHDRKRGKAYRVGPLLRVRLNALPFNSEDYSPLLYRLSAMYSFVRQRLEGKDYKALTFEDTAGPESYTAYKFWVHPENLLEVKTIILRRLPVLVYNPQTSKVAQGSEPDPTVTSLYFDDPKFDLYTEKVNHDGKASSLRLRWYGQLQTQPQVMLEKKVIHESGESEEQRILIKPKYIMPFIKGEYHMEKSIAKMEARPLADMTKVQQFKDAVKDIQDFVITKKLQPVVRANYSRTAFEVPGDDRVRISLDTNLAFIREDTLDSNRPCRDPEDWHRHDIDSTSMEYPFTNIHKGEVHHFQFAILEIKVRGNKKYEWLDDLMSSHLVKDVPRFSKFIDATSVLFEDYVNVFPFWKGLADTDIRIDPQIAFQLDQDRKAKIAAEADMVGSLFGAAASPRGGYRLSASPSGKSPVPPTSFPRATADMTRTEDVKGKGKNRIVEEDEEVDEGATQVPEPEEPISTVAGLRALFPSFSTSKYAQRHSLPPGVTKPDFWIKDQGPVRVEAKVWLANQRTFIKWQHITVLLASLSLGLYNAAGRDNTIARALAIIYTGFAIFAGCWGYGVYMWRSNLIQKRSPKDFDNRLGPVIICAGLAIALILNFVFKVRISNHFNHFTN
jgi:SPX domain protein involved in polyphosphate accumulation